MRKADEALPEGARIRRARLEDALLIALMERESFSRPWTEDDAVSALTRPEYYCLLLEADGEAAGYLIAMRLFEQGDLLRIAVRPACRARGFGRALLEVMRRENPQVAEWFLDVRAGNDAARRLYEVTGFETLRLRPDLYEDPREDGLMMRWEVGT